MELPKGIIIAQAVFTEYLPEGQLKWETTIFIESDFKTVRCLTKYALAGQRVRFLAFDRDGKAYLLRGHYINKIT